MNRQDLQQLAEDRILDAQALLDAGRWSAAYYLAGYAVECALKACVAKMTREYDFPDIQRARSSYTHSLGNLVVVAKLNKEHQVQLARSAVFRDNWLNVKDWNEQSRYEQNSEGKARILFQAIADPVDGVLPWIKLIW